MRGQGDIIGSVRAQILGQALQDTTVSIDRLTLSDLDFQIKGQTARLYSTETHFGGGQHFGNMPKSASPKNV